LKFEKAKNRRKRREKIPYLHVNLSIITFLLTYIQYIERGGCWGLGPWLLLGCTVGGGDDTATEKEEVFV